MKKILILCAILLTSTLHAAEYGKSLNFSLKNDHSREFREYETSHGLYFEKNAESEYKDLYFDTPNLKLHEKNLSLRIRYENNKGRKRYYFQFRGEEDSHRFAPRKSEEVHLVGQTVKTPKGWIKLESVLEEFFRLSSSRSRSINVKIRLKKNREYITRWLHSYQALRLKPLRYVASSLSRDSYSNIKKLQPVLVGISLRMRFHIFGKEGHGFGNQLKNLNHMHTDLPKHFIEYPDHIWLMEGYSDTTNYKYLIGKDFNAKSFNDLRIENKYLSKDEKVIDTLLSSMTDTFYSEFNAKKEIFSRYHQLMDRFRD